MTRVATEQHPVIAHACLLVVSTYPANGVTDLKLQHWASHPEHGELREIQAVHDCFAALHKMNAPAETALAHISRMKRFAEMHAAPSDQRFGSTQVLVVQIPDVELANSDICRALIDTVSGQPTVPTIESLPDGNRLACLSEDTLLLICGPEQINACLAFAFGPLRLLETLRHKVLGQFAEYENAFRQPYLDATSALRNGLQRLNSSWIRSSEQGDSSFGGSSRAVRESHQVTQNYTTALLAQGPVRQIETMLTANLRNLDQTFAAMMPNHRAQILKQRTTSLQMLLAQVRSDVQYAQPMLEAAQSVTQSFHTQMLADLAGEEAKENEQRAAESTQRDRHALTLTLLGLWIGMNQVSNGWLSLPEPVKQWHLINLLGCLALPTILTAVFFLGMRVLTWRKQVLLAGKDCDL